MSTEFKKVTVASPDGVTDTRFEGVSSSDAVTVMDVNNVRYRIEPEQGGGIRVMVWGGSRVTSIRPLSGDDILILSEKRTA